eukprot:TRINITY_DN18922_c0_g1_i1.p1 TRINITY_DN18922_c0_g1~~TRINITY_DN18922_c0_g1_i1.p1  ORF type:complete len:407 (-),score=104.56 TRINITY_DN18922_c0_g1_i1:33-1184(-)
MTSTSFSILLSIPCMLSTLFIVIDLLLNYSDIHRGSASNNACSIQQFGLTAQTEAVMNIAFAVLLIFGLRSILKLNDNLGFGSETRLLLVPMILHATALVLSVTTPNAALLLEMKVWSFIVGGITAPMIFSVLTLFPIYLSMKEEKSNRDNKRRYFHSKMIDSSIQIKILLTAYHSNSQGSGGGSSVKDDAEICPDSEEFERLLKSTAGRKRFLNFLELELAVEDLIFYESAKDFFKRYDDSKEGAHIPEAKADAEYICEMFVVPSAIGAVELSEGVRRRILLAVLSQRAPRSDSVLMRRTRKSTKTGQLQQQLQEETSCAGLITSRVFESARMEIWNKMLKGAYPRFLAQEQSRHQSDRHLEPSLFETTDHFEMMNDSEIRA